MLLAAQLRSTEPVNARHSQSDPFAGGDFTITIDNMGKQVDDYLATMTPDPNALYLLWGGGNDLFDNSSDANVIATSNRINALISRLATAGARNFLVPNVPPLGAIPNYKGHTAKIISLDAASADYRTPLIPVLTRRSTHSPLRESRCTSIGRYVAEHDSHSGRTIGLRIHRNSRQRARRSSGGSGRISFLGRHSSDNRRPLSDRGACGSCFARRCSGPGQSIEHCDTRIGRKRR